MQPPRGTGYIALGANQGPSAGNKTGEARWSSFSWEDSPSRVLYYLPHNPMVLYIIGLGLADERDITVK